MSLVSSGILCIDNNSVDISDDKAAEYHRCGAVRIGVAVVAAADHINDIASATAAAAAS